MRMHESIIHDEENNQFKMVTPLGTALINYHKVSSKEIFLNNTEFADGIDESGDLFLLVKYAVNTLRTYKIKTHCTWINAYMKLYPEPLNNEEV